MLHTLYIHGWEERQNQNFDQSKKVTDDVFITLAHLEARLRLIFTTVENPS